MSDFTARFTGRAEAYSRYRPGYPRGILKALSSEIGLDVDDVVVDVGSGTGILSELFLENGNTVYCVEPNEDMRREAEERLRPKFPTTFKSVKGRAERTTLPSSSTNVLVVGQALHWFDLERARREFTRILRPGGHACVLYNDRVRGKGLMAAYGRIVESFHSKMPKSDLPNLNKLFSRYETLSFPNSQRLDFEGLLGRLFSASYAPDPADTAGREKLSNTVRRIFSKYEKDGRVTLRYRTRVYVGTVKRPASSPRTAASSRT